MVSKLLLVPWFMTVLYSSIPLFWFAIHPAAPLWRQNRRSPYVYLLPIWALIIGSLSLATWPWHSAELYSGWWRALVALPALVIFSGSLQTYRRIGPEFGISNFIGENELRPQEESSAPVTSGLHRRMRHPIYIAHLTMMAAWTLASGLAVNFALLAISILVTFPLMIWIEERELEMRFGQSYRDYKKNVPVIPGLRLHRHRAEEQA